MRIANWIFQILRTAIGSDSWCWLLGHRLERHEELASYQTMLVVDACQRDSCAFEEVVSSRPLRLHEILRKREERFEC
jgi:hypothetical protein